MPKIIENLKEKIIAETKRQVEENGYQKTTVRSVSEKAGIAVGTVYNYFGSKEELVASFMLADWQKAEEDLINFDKSSKKAYLNHVYDVILKFEESHAFLFSDPDAEKVFITSFSEKHKILRNRIADFILPVCSGKNAEFISKVVSEVLISFTTEKEDFSTIYDAIKPLLGEPL